jgi:hypothetical protein
MGKPKKQMVRTKKETRKAIDRKCTLIRIKLTNSIANSNNRILFIDLMLKLTFGI